MKKILIMKFGGAALSSVNKIVQMASVIQKRSMLNPRIIVVVSAMGKTTDKLMALGRKICEKPSKREQDMLISAGERISMALLAMALKKHSIEAISFTGRQSGIITSSNHCEAKIIHIKPDRILTELRNNKIVIVAGFQGVSENKEITTLGRGGSDTTAVALAAALKAEKVEFYKDVSGICEEDPKMFSFSKVISEMNYDQAIKIIRKGACILHERSVHLAKKNKIFLHILPFKRFNLKGFEKKGTKIGKENLESFADSVYEE